MQRNSHNRGRTGSSAAALCQWVALLCVTAAVAGLSLPAGAVEVVSLYTAEVPFDPSEQGARANAYRNALNEVLVRVTGEAAAPESEELLLLFPNPADFVMQYRPGEEGTLIVSLDGVAIERILRRAGATVWGSERPLTVIWLAVDWGLGEREIISADDPRRVPGDGRSIDRNRLLRERVQDAATRRGIPIVFPLMDTTDLQSIGFSDIWGGFDDQLLEASVRYEAPSVLVGRIRADATQPPRWTWYLSGSRFGWPGSPEEAVAELANALAGRYAFQGDQALETVDLTISGIDSAEDFARVQRFMDNLRVTESLQVLSVAAGRITYRVELQGGRARLENAIGLSSLLEPVGLSMGVRAPLEPPGYPGFEDRPIADQSMEYRLRAPAGLPPAQDQAENPVE